MIWSQKRLPGSTLQGNFWMWMESAAATIFNGHGAADIWPAVRQHRRSDCRRKRVDAGGDVGWGMRITGMKDRFDMKHSG